MRRTKESDLFVRNLRRTPDAISEVRGSVYYPAVEGTVYFYQTEYGVLIKTEVYGLPYSTLPCEENIFAFHIHDGNSCTGNASDPFSNSRSHFNPDHCEHLYHAGDMPPLFGNHGYALSIFLTDRFALRDVIGRTVIIHSLPDDFHTEPFGNPGVKMACGVILET